MHFGERIRQAREIRGWTQEQLASEIRRSKSLIAQVEAGFRLPSDGMVEAVAAATKLPLPFFNDPPHSEFPIAEVLFRAPRTIKRRQVLDAIRYAEHVFTIYAKIAQQVRDVPCQIPEAKTHPAEAARQVKKDLGLKSDEPTRTLVRPLERAGVCFIVIPQMEIGDAFSLCADWRGSQVRPLIACKVNNEAADRTRLSIAHELGHLVLHRSFLRKTQSEIEEEAFSFAAEWLMPELAMRDQIREPVTLTSLAKLKPVWGVSIAALIRRAFELKLITQRQYHYLFHQLSALGWKTREPESLDVPLERPRMLRKMAEVVYGNPIDFVALAADTHISAEELRMIISNYEEGAKEERLIQPKVIRFSR